MNALDKLIASFSPERGLKRLHARATLDRISGRTQAERAYEGAKTGRRTGGWISGNTSADAEISSSIQKLRDRSRSLIRDNPYAARARDVFCANVVGTGIIVKAGPAKDAWDRWVNECDADGLVDFYGMQALVMRCMFESGECLIRFRERRPEDGLIVPLQLQVMEPDYLDQGKVGNVAGGGWIVHGVEYNAIGQRVAYWLFSQHPGDSATYKTGLQSKRIPAEQILHIFERGRPGQSRGVPRLASVLLKMRDLDDYEEAELVRKGIESCFSAIVTTEDMGSGLNESTTDQNGNRIESLGAGLIQYLKPGQDIRFGAPSASGDYGNYTKTQLRAIAAGIGITYEQLTGDLSDVNYSSIRAGLIEFYRSVDMLQWHCIIPMMLAPIWKRWSETAYAVRAIKQKPEAYPQWTTPRRQWVDPLKDVNAARQELAAGITSLSEVIRTRGEDPEKVFAEIAKERETLRTLGITVDTIPPEALPPEPDPETTPAKKREQAAAYERELDNAIMRSFEAQSGRVEAATVALASAVREQAAPVVNVHIDGPVMNSPPVEVRNEINLPEQAPPVVNVAATEVRNEITMPNQPAPVVNVSQPEIRNEITVQPAEVKVEIPARKTETTITRDKAGNIAKATQIETDI